MAEHSHEHQHHTSGQMGKHGRPYAKFWVNMVLGLVVMYFVMFSMIDGARDFRNNLSTCSTWRSLCGRQWASSC